MQLQCFVQADGRAGGPVPFWPPSPFKQKAEEDKGGFVLMQPEPGSGNENGGGVRLDTTDCARVELKSHTQFFVR